MNILCGMTALSGDGSSTVTKIPIKDIIAITIQNCIADSIFVSKNPNLENTPSVTEWNYDTIMLGEFKNNLLAGNLSFALDTITSMRIKQREKGTFQWRTIFEIPIEKEEDLAFTRNYLFNKSNVNYEFAIIPVLNTNVEGSINITECRSEFKVDYLVEKERMLKIILNVTYEQTRHQNGTTIETLGRKKPVYISNGDINYDSGSFTATFIALDNDREFDLENAVRYRREVDNFLTNHKKKIFKTSSGDMWLVNIVGDLPRQIEHCQNPVHTINWVETGDCESTTDMFNANLLDVDYENI